MYSQFDLLPPSGDKVFSKKEPNTVYSTIDFSKNATKAVLKQPNPIETKLSNNVVMY